MIRKISLSLSPTLILIAFLSVLISAAPAEAERPLLSPEIESYPENSTSSDLREEKTEKMEVVVKGKRTSPDFSQGRRFLHASFWRLDPGTRELSLWYRAKHQDSEGWREEELILELEEGITSFLQLDVIVSAARDAADDSWREKGVGIEARIAPQRKYGVWPLNPVLYLEYMMRKNSPSLLETTLLLGGKITGNWHGVMNGFLELKPGEGELEEFGFSAATALEIEPVRGLSAGLESKLEFEEETELRNGEEEREYEPELFLGPSLSYSIPRTDLKLVSCVLFSVGGESFSIEPVFVASFDF
jgi:hypothetical protein